MCFYRNAQGAEGREEARRRLTSLIPRHPERPWLSLVLGHVEVLATPKVAESSYRRAALGFRSQHDAEGEVLAGINLRNVLSLQGRTEEAKEWELRVSEVANASGVPQLRARALILEASALSDAGRDLGHAWRLLKQAEALTFPSGSDGLKKQCLTALGRVSERLGRLDEASEVYLRLAELARATREPATEARVRFDLANLAMYRGETDPQPGVRAEVLGLASEALRAAEAAGSKVFEAQALRLIAELLGDTPDAKVEAEACLQRCLALADELSQPERRIACLWTRAERMARENPVAAEREADEALRQALDHGRAFYVLSAWRARATVALRGRPLPQALDEAEHLLGAIEALRELQGDAFSQAELFARWVGDYHRLAGLMLEAGTAPTPRVPPREALSRAFQISERLRARTLLDALASARALPERQDTAPARAAVMRRLVAVQRQLLETSLSAEAREAARREVSDLEREELDLRPRPRRAVSEIVSLDATEHALAEDEALLVFLVGAERDVFNEPAGGAWVMSVTRAGTRAYRLPERSTLTSAAALLSGLIERRDGSEGGLASALYAQLLAPALTDLPPGVRRLLLVPDGPLHDMPFAMLREHPDGPPLVARYELARVPSASLWRYWRERSMPTPGGQALVLADPERGAGTMTAQRVTQTREGVFDEVTKLGALPQARAEGHAVEEILRDSSLTPRLLVGTEASERALKEAATVPPARPGEGAAVPVSKASAPSSGGPRPATSPGHGGTDASVQTAASDGIRLLHVAAHAAVDPEDPERSALVLAPGGPDEDGMLQPREIVSLGLSDALVVLSSCRSASGAALPGEGVFSLARAFFEAGARAVVASLWPLRDDETASLMRSFHAHLASGQSAAAALRAAQLDAQEAGLPAAAWAGVVVLGDGAWAAVTPRAARGWAGLEWAWVVGVLVLASALGLGWRWRHVGRDEGR
ncbi:CHAT domain-containing protein [Myxococcaceae bacterium JPH2]|nr:CHAT domain-containing protein [Myxococcaceae bacterium JPH2]